MRTRRAFLSEIVAGVAAPLVARSSAEASKNSGPPMRTRVLPHANITVSRIAYGFGELGGWDEDSLSQDALGKAAHLIRTAYDNGITFFDVADMSGFGRAETAFGKVLRESAGLRDKIVIQSKCGMCFVNDAEVCFTGRSKISDPIYLNVTRAHIVESVEGSLRRLGTDRLDSLLLHWPDALVEPEEVAEAFDNLEKSGKVRFFGVSNHSVSQIELLKRAVRQPLTANQIPFGLAHAKSISDTATVDYCRLHDIQVQAWSPLRGLLNPPANASPSLKAVAGFLAKIAVKRNTNPAAVALAWILRHPAGIVPIIGSTKPQHIIEACAADRIELSRAEWYALASAASTPS